MKPAACTVLLLLLLSTARAQLTLLPQAGFDRSRTFFRINDNNRFAPAGALLDLKAALRLDYRLRSGQGAYVSVGTSPAPVSFRFDRPVAAASEFRAQRGSLLWRLEAGYQYTSKAIALGKGQTKEKQTRAESKQCSPFGCGSRVRTTKASKARPTLRLQPSVGFAWVPEAPAALEMKGNTYQYNGGSWTKGLVSGMGLEFGKGRQRWFTLGLQYTKALDPASYTLNTEENGKPLATRFRSQTSAWSATLGIPISLKAATKTHAQKKPYSSQGCRSRCNPYNHCPRRLN